VALTVAEDAAQASSDRLGRATGLLSRYPAGMIPVDPGVIDAISQVGDAGGRDEVSLLRNLVENERPEVQQAASVAIASIRDRQRQSQREAFAQDLPDWPDLQKAAAPYQSAGLGREESICVAYSGFVLGTSSLRQAKPGDGDAATLLAAGRPRKALSAALAEDTRDARRWEARAREDLGDVTGAVHGYALLAAGGDVDARAALDGFGVDAERLLLGMLANPDEKRGHSEAEVLEVLVRNGNDLTVSVLAERTRSKLSSDRATAADALSRMLDAELREQPLPQTVQRAARRALSVATREGPEPVRVIATEALKSHALAVSAAER
jgi:hypothetical protein